MRLITLAQVSSMFGTLLMRIIVTWVVLTRFGPHALASILALLVLVEGFSATGAGYLKIPTHYFKIVISLALLAESGAYIFLMGFHQSFAVIAIVMSLAALFRGIAAPGSAAMIPLITENQDDLLANNGYVETAVAVIGSLGELVGGWALRLWSWDSGWIAATTTLFAAVFWILVKVRPGSPMTENPPARVVRKMPTLREILPLLALLAVMNLIEVGPTAIGLPLIVHSILRRSSVSFGIMSTIMTLGTITAGIATQKISERVLFGKFRLIMVVEGGLFATIGLTTHWMVLGTTLWFLWAGVSMLAGLLILTAVQKILPEDALASGMGLLQGVGYVSQPISMLAASMVMTMGHVPRTLVISGLLIVLLGALAPIQRFRFQVSQN